MKLNQIVEAERPLSEWKEKLAKISNIKADKISDRVTNQFRDRVRKIEFGGMMTDAEHKKEVSNIAKELLGN